MLDNMRPQNSDGFTMSVHKGKEEMSKEMSKETASRRSFTPLTYFMFHARTYLPSFILNQLSRAARRVYLAVSIVGALTSRVE
jgi:hypothetical protein